jgi:hypothetical protein
MSVAGYVARRRISREVGWKGDLRVDIFVGMLELLELPFAKDEVEGVGGDDFSFILLDRRGVIEAIALCYHMSK